MGMRFRLRGLAETFIDSVTCPKCGCSGQDDDSFSTGNTKVTLEGIVVIAECKECGEIFVPGSQRRGVINPGALRDAVERDSVQSGEPLLSGSSEVSFVAQKLNALRRGDLH